MNDLLCQVVRFDVRVVIMFSFVCNGTDGNRSLRAELQAAETLDTVLSNNRFPVHNADIPAEIMETLDV